MENATVERHATGGLWSDFYPQLLPCLALAENRPSCSHFRGLQGTDRRQAGWPPPHTPGGTPASAHRSGATGPSLHRTRRTPRSGWRCRRHDDCGQVDLEQPWGSWRPPRGGVGVGALECLGVPEPPIEVCGLRTFLAHSFAPSRVGTY